MRIDNLIKLQENAKKVEDEDNCEVTVQEERSSFDLFKYPNIRKRTFLLMFLW